MVSENVVLIFKTPEGRIQQKKTESYLQAFGEETRIKRRIFAVVAHEITVSHINTYRQEETIANLYNQNPSWKREGSREEIEILKII